MGSRAEQLLGPCPCPGLWSHTRHSPPNALRTNMPSTCGVLDPCWPAGAPQCSSLARTYPLLVLTLRHGPWLAVPPGGSQVHRCCPRLGQSQPSSAKRLAGNSVLPPLRWETGKVLAGSCVGSHPADEGKHPFDGFPLGLSGSTAVAWPGVFTPQPLCQVCAQQHPPSLGAAENADLGRPHRPAQHSALSWLWGLGVRTRLQGSGPHLSHDQCGASSVPSVPRGWAPVPLRARPLPSSKGSWGISLPPAPVPGLHHHPARAPPGPHALYNMVREEETKGPRVQQAGRTGSPAAGPGMQSVAHGNQVFTQRHFIFLIKSLDLEERRNINLSFHLFMH